MRRIFLEDNLRGRPPGESAIIVPAELAYGRRGVPKVPIGPNETLILEIELLKVE